MLQVAMLNGCGANDQPTISNRIGHARVFFRAGKQGRGAHRGSGFAKRNFVRIDDSKPQKTEVAHGTRRRAEIERITRPYQNHAQTVEFSREGQEALFYDTCAMRKRP